MKDHPMFQYIHESNLIEGFDSEEMDQQGIYAWDYLKDQPKLTHAVIKKVQKVITLKQPEMQPHWRGYYRDVPNIDVRVAGRLGTPAQEVPIAMNLWLSSFVKSLSPKEAHIQFELIHPFVDGNGRTGRMLMWWQEIKEGKEPTLIKDSEKQEYYKWFKLADLADWWLRNARDL